MATLGLVEIIVLVMIACAVILLVGLVAGFVLRGIQHRNKPR